MIKQPLLSLKSSLFQSSPFFVNQHDLLDSDIVSDVELRNEIGMNQVSSAAARKKQKSLQIRFDDAMNCSLSFLNIASLAYSVEICQRNFVFLPFSRSCHACVPSQAELIKFRGAVNENRVLDWNHINQEEVIKSNAANSSRASR